MTLQYMKTCCAEIGNQNIGMSVDYNGDEVIGITCKVCGYKWNQDILVYTGHYLETWNAEEDLDETVRG